ncbi:hypothetical protein ACQP2X_37155 [Actinoplanes sp. CA-131856]
MELRVGLFRASLGLGVLCRGRPGTRVAGVSSLVTVFRARRFRSKVGQALVCLPVEGPPRWAGRDVVGRSSRSEGRARPGGVVPKLTRDPTVSTG